MAEGIKYVVGCCSDNPLAYIDDNRSTGGELSISAPPGASQIVIGYQSREGLPRPTHDVVAGTWGNSTLSRTVWEDDGDYADTGRTQWTVSCDGCTKRAEMRTQTLERVADALATELKAFAPVPCPDGQQRHLIPLGVLNLKLTRLDR
jgi:hypothetical protein